ncbi:phosphatidylglycerophosphatase A [Tropicimonas sp.]|uniref:phosphatidylglycerophosphatase A family protein n=1 Tax=Tropicimonas sp. TaxID=2067044 RepID=UPI003A8A5A09
MTAARLVATFGGVGLLRPAPGSWGSAAAIPVAWLIHGLGGFPALAAATLVVFLAGWRATAAVIAGGPEPDPDPSEIVIDEVAGQWLALWPLSAGLWHAGVAPWIFPYPGWIGAFLFFRLFDIWKPWPVSWADRRHDALGVMLDDVIAGIMAAIVVSAAAAISHGWLMQ